MGCPGLQPLRWGCAGATPPAFSGRNVGRSNERTRQPVRCAATARRGWAQRAHPHPSGRRPAPSVSKNETQKSRETGQCPKTGQSVAPGGPSGAGEGQSVGKLTPSGSRGGPSVRKLARSGSKLGRSGAQGGRSGRKVGQSGSQGGQSVDKAGQSGSRMGLADTPDAHDLFRPGGTGRQ